MRKTLAPVVVLPLLAAAGPLLPGCSQTEPPSPEPPLGRACFELHRPALPAGSQYEGAAQQGARITVRVMTGVDLATRECRVLPDGTLALGGGPGPEPAQGD
jgi:hypothetical protein